MPAADPNDRTTIARLAAAERWGRVVDRTAATAPARAALRAKYAAEIDPAGTLSPDELEKRVDHLQHAHMLRMARKATVTRVKARAAAVTARKQAEIRSALGDVDADLVEGGGDDA